MRYASIDCFDVSNGKGVGVTLFVQGCHRHCSHCFNPETWDFNGGYEYTQETFENLIELIKRPYIQRFTLLGGEPLEECNMFELSSLLHKIRKECPGIKIWCYTGYTYEELMERANDKQYTRYLAFILENIDVLVDGDFQEENKNISLAFRGSTNQRIIDLPKTLKQKKVVLYEL